MINLKSTLCDKGKKSTYDRLGPFGPFLSIYYTHKCIYCKSQKE